MAGDRQPINQPSMAPTTKVAVGGVAGALTLLVVWILGLLHVAVPPPFGRHRSDDLNYRPQRPTPSNSRWTKKPRENR